jgi:hypothetical protein
MCGKYYQLGVPKTRIGQAPARWIVDSLLDHLAEFRLVWCDTTIRLELGTKRKWVARAQNVADDKTQSGRRYRVASNGWTYLVGDGEQCVRNLHAERVRGF